MSTDRAARIIFWSIVLLGAVDRCLILELTRPFASNDLVLIWHASQDYAHGAFHEPFFYGQNYGVMLEALIAAPFVAAGADPITAVPWAIAFLAMVPFWSFAYFHYRRSDMVAASLFAALPLLLPPEHGIQYTNLNGLALLAFYPWVQGMAASAVRSFLIGTVLVASTLVNHNAAFACIAFGTWFLLAHTRKPALLGWFLAGALPVLLLWYAALEFCAHRAHHMVNTIYDWRFDFHPYLIGDALSGLPAHFAWLCPIWWNNGQVILLAIILTAIVHFRNGERSIALALASALALVLLSFGYPKIHDGTSSVFFPLSRAFLALPLLLGWALSRLPIGRTWAFRCVVILAVTTLCTFSVRTIRGPAVMARALSEQDDLPLRTIAVRIIRDQCATIHRHARRTQADALVFLREPDIPFAEFMNIGCPVCEPDMAQTYMVGGDRRGWRKVQEATTHHQNILVVGGGHRAWDIALNGPFDVVRIQALAPMVHLVRHPGMPVEELVERIRSARP